MKSLFPFVALAASIAALTTASAQIGGNHEREGVGKRAEAQLALLAAGISPYRDFEVARARGWKQFAGEDTPLMGEHWFREGGPDYVHGDRIDFAQPSNLMYTKIDGRRVLTGVAFTVRLAPSEPVPAGFDGPNDKWHVHDFERAIKAALQDRPVLRWLANGWLNRNYRDKGDNRGRIAMVHAWVTLPNPDGVFADYNRALPYLKLGLPAAHAQGASVEAAKGLNLATSTGCKDGVNGALWIGNANGETTKRIRAACATAAAHVREGLASGDKSRINAMGEHGWAMFDAAWNRELTATQRQRIAAMNEHGEGHGGHSHRDQSGSPHRHEQHD
ncbi:MAG: hypothetical protein H0W74_12265 [Sphingosinicella sp.]|nr:hypothetical protein [Sphingosinicella sp.]